MSAVTYIASGIKPAEESKSIDYPFCRVHYFYYEGKKKEKQLCFSITTDEAGIINVAPPVMGMYMDRPIQVLIADHPEYKHHEID